MDDTDEHLKINPAYALGGAGVGALVGNVPGAAIGTVAGMGVDVSRQELERLIKKLRKKIQDKEGKLMDKESEFRIGFVSRCMSRGVNPAAVIEWTKRAQAESQRVKVAQQAYESMTPWQQGFAVRCAQRGVPVGAVLKFAEDAVAGSADDKNKQQPAAPAKPAANQQAPAKTPAKAPASDGKGGEKSDKKEDDKKQENAGDSKKKKWYSNVKPWQIGVGGGALGAALGGWLLYNNRKRKKRNALEAVNSL